MKYSLPTIMKAVVGGAVTAVSAASTAAGGVDLSVLDLGQWIGVIGAGLVGFAAVFVTPNKDHNPAPEQPVLPLPQVVLGGLQQAAQNKAAAESDLDQIRDGVGQILGTVPTVGPLAQSAIDSLKLPRL